MLTLRLKRIGRRHDASFRVVAVDSRQGPKSGKQIETLGTYNPRSNERSLKADRISHWLSQGAQTSDTVHNLLVSEGIIDSAKVNALPKKSPIQKEGAEEGAEAAAAPAETAESTETQEPTEPKEEVAEESKDSDSEKEAEVEGADKAEEAESTDAAPEQEAEATEADAETEEEKTA